MVPAPTTPAGVALAALSFATLVAGSLAGCQQREPTREETAARAAEASKNADPERVNELLHPAGERVASENDAAMQSIASARCGRAERCREVGSGRPFIDRDTCMTDVLDDLRVDLSAANCPGGIVEKELDECLAEIENEDCGSTADAIERVIACRSSDMCKWMN